MNRREHTGVLQNILVTRRAQDSEAGPCEAKDMTAHHPSIDILTGHAAGVLPIAQAACVTAHLNYCEQCRRGHERLQTIGGVLFETLPPVAVEESVLDSVLARLDDPVPLSY